MWNKVILVATSLLIIFMIISMTSCDLPSRMSLMHQGQNGNANNNDVRATTNIIKGSDNIDRFIYAHDKLREHNEKIGRYFQKYISEGKHKFIKLKAELKINNKVDVHDLFEMRHKYCAKGFKPELHDTCVEFLKIEHVFVSKLSKKQAEMLKFMETEKKEKE